ncbi:MAG: hypothetical protein ACR2Q4_03230 [Geminicoccaceae bacterium]
MSIRLGGIKADEISRLYEGKHGCHGQSGDYGQIIWRPAARARLPPGDRRIGDHRHSPLIFSCTSDDPRR